MRTMIALSAVILAALTSGCGTICNLAGERPVVYGGDARSMDSPSR